MAMICRSFVLLAVFWALNAGNVHGQQVQRIPATFDASQPFRLVGHEGPCQSCGVQGGCVCPSAGCDLGDCCDPYAFTIRFGGVFMDRNNARGSVFEDPTSGARVRAPDLGLQAGPKINIIRHRDGLELGYFAIFSDSAINVGMVDDSFQIPTIAPIPVLDDGVFVNNYRSTLTSSETNFRRDWSDRLTVLGGFRWISLSEDFDSSLLAPGGAQAVVSLTDTRNNLFGLQLGAEMQVMQRGCFSLEATCKAGVYYNFVNHNTVLAGAPAPGILNINDSTSQAAFQGEVELLANYQYSERLSLRAGYQLMWLEGVALAPDQISAINLGSSSGIDMSGSPFYHGATVQGVLLW